VLPVGLPLRHSPISTSSFCGWRSRP